MILTSLCPPALIYFVFMLCHVILATFKDQYNDAILQFILGTLMTMLLQLLCYKGMTLISWIIVFIPFIFYTYMIMIIYYVFGINPERTDIEEVEEDENNEKDTDETDETQEVTNDDEEKKNKNKNKEKQDTDELEAAPVEQFSFSIY